ncbi:hypothetical protein O59_001476 [Cellvibrio sp. BR]|nr:hypothetical protein O59_001476 [Cellvibrio sp. BR]
MGITPPEKTGRHVVLNPLYWLNSIFHTALIMLDGALKNGYFVGGAAR